MEAAGRTPSKKATSGLPFAMAFLIWSLLFVLQNGKRQIAQRYAVFEPHTQQIRLTSFLPCLEIGYRHPGQSSRRSRWLIIAPFFAFGLRGRPFPGVPMVERATRFSTKARRGLSGPVRLGGVLSASKVVGTGGRFSPSCFLISSFSHLQMRSIFVLNGQALFRSFQRTTRIGYESRSFFAVPNWIWRCKAMAKR